MTSPAQPASAPTFTPSPLNGRERNHSLDIIRGVAIFGLIWVHSQGPVSTVAVADNVSSWAEVVFADGKFWTMFSILFGATLAMQLDRAEARGEKFAARWLRRMAVLFAIGCANPCCSGQTTFYDNTRWSASCCCFSERRHPGPC